ncbi:KDEL motif-containing protein 1-like isoform X2 [Hyposmocoma kahamanoa]|uniref:KDEL motif-containing protein 1-like isoform X2 n=1 Tax=Hyposmocoma kahamanoa TaxID=1477025 RepID=UPI000E6D7A92|nr:KDEL motif-containing protein 1-like isoform X2 [Hyposmocoma kahamanoa]
MLYFIYLLLFVSTNCENAITLFGPGLEPQKIVLPARYFFVNFTSFNENSYVPQLGKDLAIEVLGRSKKDNHCRVWVNKLDRKDGTFIVRYKMYETCYDVSINVYYKSKHIKGSPLTFSDQCNCPEKNFNKWLQDFGCPASYEQIDHALKPFSKVDMEQEIKKIIKKFHRPESTSFCHYIIKDNQVYRDCYGKHVGFNMFADNILLFMSRKVNMPDMELVINLGDWPLVQKGSKELPVFSWCGNHDTIDIVMPTYDITESALENMGRVTLDTLSVQGSIDRTWPQRESRAFWRGRDSREERLKLIDIARANPELFNASLTNFFFFRNKEAEYGPKQPHISFFKFFDYKYQINIDGTVAAYRFPYLLAGGGLVLKQDSPYYEHFYPLLKPWEHYVPVRRDLLDLKERVLWALEHDDAAYRIAQNARKFANENLLPQHIVCYHAVLFSKWSKRIVNKITVPDDMTRVTQPKFECDCDFNAQKNREEL